MKQKYTDEQFRAYCQALLYYLYRTDNQRFKDDPFSPWPSIICWLIALILVAVVSYCSLMASPW